MITSRVCNPTPFKVDFNFHGGVNIVIEADGFVDLQSTLASEQFRPDLPGTEAVREEMTQVGIFLRDPMVPFEVQAIKALTGTLNYKKSLYNDAKNNLRSRAAAQGVYNEDAFAETLDRLGYTRLLVDVDKLEKRLKLYQSKVDPATLNRPLHKQYDPKRTLLFLSPPKEFESEIAMEIFLAEHPDMASKQKAWMNQFSKTEKTEKEQNA